MSKSPTSSTEQLICLTSAISTYGIPKMILEKHLSNPILKTNPNHPSGPKMRLYKISDIESLLKDEGEKGEGTRKAIEKRKERAISSRKATETKMKQMEERIKEAIKMIEVYEDDEVELNAMKSYNSFQSYKASNYYNYDSFDNWIDINHPEKLDRSFLERITVNYIRHELTEYDESLWEMKGKVGIVRFYVEYKNAVLDKIAEVYPKYKKECERQKW